LAAKAAGKGYSRLQGLHILNELFEIRWRFVKYRIGKVVF